MVAGNEKGSPLHIIIDEINSGLICPILSIPIIWAGSLVIFEIQSDFESPNRNKCLNV
jgi:hypothetical protein